MIMKKKYELYIGGMLFASFNIEDDNKYEFIPVEYFGLDEISIEIIKSVLEGTFKRTFILESGENEYIEINEGSFSKNIEKYQLLQKENYFPGEILLV
jgi:hypothetical protein